MHVQKQNNSPIHHSDFIDSTVVADLAVVDHPGIVALAQDFVTVLAAVEDHTLAVGLATHPRR